MNANHNETETEEIQNDDVVGAALLWSVAGIALLAVGGGLFWYLTSKTPEEITAVGEPTVLPDKRAIPTMVIPDIPFTDITEAAGIDFVHENGAEGEKLLPETMGGGGAFLDFDNDGDQDLLCINSTVWPWAKEKPATPPTSALYANDGIGKFTNVTADSGLDIEMYGNGVACGDFDNDGDVDIFVTCVGPNHLFRNEGGGKFLDITLEAGVAGDEKAWGTSCGFFDYDVDGDLDLFVCNYIEWSREIDASMEFTLDGTLRAYGRPTDFKGAFPYLYRNDGSGKFTDVSEQAGVQIRASDTGVPLSKSLGVTFPDVNGDGLLDIIVANDTVQNLLLLNQPGGTFVESAATAGVAFDNSGGARGAMGIDAACFRNTDAIAIAIANFATEMTALYVCQTPGAETPLFRDEAVSNGLGPLTRTDLKFGVFFLDVDLDGRMDLFENNGHLEEDINLIQVSQHYEQSPHLLWNCGPEADDEFVMLTEEKTSPDFMKRMVGRGASMADIDGDGDLDLALFSSGGHPRLLRNDQHTGNHWLRVHLTGTTCNKDAIGAQVDLTLPNGTVLTRTVMPTRSYQSQVELPVTFGLGQHDSFQSLKLHWPGGQTQELPAGAANRLIEATQSP
ncbi:MAG TPA: CRTAC1 family protein [Planctomycetaceae bacterium]|nr:CRTAC1 family protein [Planctomycetaceae bacterium]